jgi:hypothetical protein
MNNMYDQLLKQLTQLNDLGEVTINFASGIARNAAKLLCI